MKTKFWIIIFILVAVSCAAASFLLKSLTGQGDIVGIYQDGQLLYSINLSEISQPYEIELSYKGSTNTILVASDGVEIIHADCPDQTCVNHGKLKQGGTPIICLPNRVVIKWTDGSGEYDAVSR